MKGWTAAIYSKGLCFNNVVLFPTGRSMTPVIIHIHLCTQRHTCTHMYKHKKTCIWSDRYCHILSISHPCCTNIAHPHQQVTIPPAGTLTSLSILDEIKHEDWKKEVEVKQNEPCSGERGSAPDVFWEKWLLHILHCLFLQICSVETDMIDYDLDSFWGVIVLLFALGK